ncbi:MAG: DUF5066 family protein [Thermonemataceae bacterium]
MKTVISTPPDFYSLPKDIFSALNKNKDPVPLSTSEISEIRLAKNRVNSDTVGLPKSIQTILAIDKNFTLNNKYFKEPLFKPFFDQMDEKKIVHSARISDELKRLFRGADLKGQDLLWNDIESMPSLIELYSPGDQGVYMYMGEVDDNNEFPIARYDDQPEVWISASSIIQYILSNTDVENLIKIEEDFNTRLIEAKKRNEGFIKKEWWHESFEFPV